MANEETVNTEAETEVVEDSQTTEQETEQQEVEEEVDETTENEQEDSKKTTKKSGGSKAEALRQERDRRKAAETELKELKDAKLAEEGKYKELYETTKKDLEELSPKAEKWNEYEENKEKALDKEIGESMKTLGGKEFLAKKQSIIDGFSNKESLNMYLKDQMELQGKKDFSSSPKGGFGLKEESTTTKIEDHRDGKTFNAGSFLMSQFQDKQ